MLDLKTLFKGDDGKMSMTVGERGISVSGVEKLAQHVTNILLTDPGHNYINPGVGAGIKAIIEYGGSSHTDISSKKSEITAGIMDTETFIKSSQIGEPLSDDEKLLSLKIARLQYNTNTREWLIDVIVSTVAGSVFIATIN